MTEQGTAIEQILRQAIRFEENAYEFYTGAVELVERPHIRQVLLDMASEEVKHKERLQDLLEGDTARIVSVRKQRQIEDLKLAEYLVPRQLPGARLRPTAGKLLARPRPSRGSEQRTGAAPGAHPEGLPGSDAV